MDLLVVGFNPGWLLRTIQIIAVLRRVKDKCKQVTIFQQVLRLNLCKEPPLNCVSTCSPALKKSHQLTPNACPLDVRSWEAWAARAPGERRGGRTCGQRVPTAGFGAAEMRAHTQSKMSWFQEGESWWNIVPFIQFVSRSSCLLTNCLIVRTTYPPKWNGGWKAILSFKDGIWSESLC